MIARSVGQRSSLLWITLFLWVPTFVYWIKMTHLWGSKSVAIVFSFIIHTENHHFVDRMLHENWYPTKIKPSTEFWICLGGGGHKCFTNILSSLWWESKLPCISIGSWISFRLGSYYFYSTLFSYLHFSGICQLYRLREISPDVKWLKWQVDNRWVIWRESD